ncbi:hypothetical protein N802_17795 [Knoellia sinensis KCTC 19936]|uniref:Uncharacterized protein n=1 Tax=Knoellia sinensis KCTC 19936 TaxID=1385520 RepID=A0A0A0JAQ4_9MICO|nr:hypothetical protein [Knoellia sinensis]KGN32701.1 hypothetical protein N802_17795 [Knoellia sinensis KCTC 19936]
MDPRTAHALRHLPQPFTAREATSADIPRSTVKHASSVAFLVSPARGLYAVREPWDAASPWERHRLMIDTAVRLFPDAIVSHTSQAVLLGLPHPSHPPDSVRMTVLDDVRTSRRSTWCRFHRGTTPPEHIEIRHGVPGFIAPRVVLDCCREVHARDALAIADGALRVGMTSLEQLFDMRRHQRRWPYVARSNDVLLLADGRRETWLESVSAWSMARWGLPTGIPQVNVFTPEGEFLGRPDAFWPDLGLVGEADGSEKYLLEGTDEQSVLQALERERLRQEPMAALGLRFVRWTPRDAIDGTAIHSRFQSLARDVRHQNVAALFRCSCCDSPLTECQVEAELAVWRRKLAKEFERKVW